MSHYRTLFVFLILALAIVTGFSQEVNTKKATKTPPVVTNQEPRADGLRKITTRTLRDWDFDIHIDEEALEANIERAVEQAMRDVEVALDKLERLEIHIDPIEINLGALDLDIEPIKINIPDLDIDIDIEPIDIDLDDLDIDIDSDEDFDYENDLDNDSDEDDEDNFLKKDKNKEKEELKNKPENKEKPDTEKTDQKEKDKAKGLKKIN